MKGIFKATVHVLIFAVAIVVFFIGLALGLQFNPNVGTLLWFTAAAIAAGNLAWIVRSRL